MAHPLRVVIIGGDATGASAAAQVKRTLGDNVVVTVIEQQSWTSYSACSIPYWIAGEIVDGPHSLVARSPQEHRRRGLIVRTRTQATAIDVEARTVTVEPVDGGPAEVLGYDELVLATGAEPVLPPLPGMQLPGVHRVHTLPDGSAAIESLNQGARRAVVIGGGYIGIEMAEAALARGLSVTMLDLADEPMGSLDPDMGALVRRSLAAAGVDYRGASPAQAVLAGDDARVRAVVLENAEVPADVVFVGPGVRPRTTLAAAAGLPLGSFGGLLTDDRQRVLGQSHVWAGGDCTEVVDRLTGARRFLPLGTHANKHGRVIGSNLGGADLRFPGVVGTAITRFGDCEIARTGLRLAEAAEFGLDLVSATVTTPTKVAILPDADQMTIKLIAERGSGRLFGGQIVGGSGAGKRIDILATALWTGLTVADVVDLDLAYAPPFSGAWDPVQIAARVLLKAL